MKIKSVKSDTNNKMTLNLLNQKIQFSDLSLEIWEIKYYFWVRKWDFHPAFCFQFLIWLLNNKLHGLSHSGGHHSLLFDQEFPKNAQLQRHLANRNTIWRYFVSMRFYLAMLFILSIEILENCSEHTVILEYFNIKE